MSHQIGSGSFGTVFWPPISHDDPALVGKVMVSDFKEGNFHDTDIEWSFKKTLFDIDPSQEHFVYPVEKREITLTQYNNFANKPLVTTNSSVRVSGCAKMVELLMPYGGYSLRWQVQRNYFALKAALEYSLQAAQNIKLLQFHDLIHLDIHLGNLVANTTNKCRLIDFGLMMSSKSFYTLANHLWGDIYAVSPPEFRLIQAKKKRIHNIASERNLLIQYIETDTDIITYMFNSPEYKQSYASLKQEMDNLSIPNKNKKNDRLQFLKSLNSHEKVDTYGLGVAMLELLAHLQLDVHEMPPYILPALCEIITKMMMPHPNDRMNIDDIIFELTEVIDVLE